jgi:hypothetical protein
VNSIILDKTNPDIAKAVAGCEVGKPQTFSITATPVADNDTILVATVDSIEYEEPAESETPEEEAPEEAASKPYKPKARKGSATAVEQMPM